MASPVWYAARHGPSLELGLQLLEPQGVRVRCRYVAGLYAGRDQCHPRRGDRHDLDDALDKMVEDGLDRESR